MAKRSSDFDAFAATRESLAIGATPSANELGGMRTELQHPEGASDTLLQTAEQAREQGPAGRVFPRSKALHETGVGPGQLPVGTAIGRYQVSGLLGVGGMGSVYAAFDPQLNRRVALKLLHYSGHDATQRIQREAQALAKLSHPNVVAVYDSGTSEHGFFIVMQYVEGTTLDVWLRQRPPASAAIVDLYAAAGAGLAAAHAAGLVHRDFKAQNVLVDHAGHVAVTDFGVARTDASASDVLRAKQTPRAPSFEGERVTPWHNHGEFDDESLEQLTQVGMIVGTPLYMAPEQHQGNNATALSDQFAFSVSLWESLFAQHPWVPAGTDLSNPFAAGVAMLDGKFIEPPNNHRVAAHVVRVLRRGLSLDPAQRWPSMQALLAELVPPAKRSKAPLVAAGSMTIVAAGIAAWSLTQKSAAVADPVKQCAATTQARIDPVWSKPTQTTMSQAFAASGVPFAASTAESTQHAITAYATRLQQLQTDLCIDATASRSAEAASRHAARQACADQALSALGGAVQSFSNKPTSILVANALGVVDQLPRLQDCDAGATPTISSTPPPELAAQIAALRDQLVGARVLMMAGQYTDAKPALEQLAKQAQTIAWQPLQTEVQAARARLAVAAQDNSMDHAALVAIASEATASGQDRLASELWSMATTAAGVARNEQSARTSAAVAAAIGKRLRDDKLGGAAQIALGRALTHARKPNEGYALCDDAAKRANASGDIDILLTSDAATCVAEALAMQGRWTDLATLVATQKPIIREAFGDAHPTMAAWLIFEYSVAFNAAEYKKARPLLEQARAIFTRVYGDDYFRTLQTLQYEANIDYWEDNSRAAVPKIRELIARVEQRTNIDPLFLSELHRDLGMAEHELKHHDICLAELAKAIELARSTGAAGVRDVAMLQVQDGQFKADEKLEYGIDELREAYETLRRLKDPRAGYALAAYAVTYFSHKRYKEALPLFELALAEDAIKDLTPYNLAILRFTLAQTLHQLKKEPARVRELATQAHADYIRSHYEKPAKIVADFIKKLR